MLCVLKESYSCFKKCSCKFLGKFYHIYDFSENLRTTFKTFYTVWCSQDGILIRCSNIQVTRWIVRSTRENEFNVTSMKHVLRIDSHALKARVEAGCKHSNQQRISHRSGIAFYVSITLIFPHRSTGTCRSCEPWPRSIRRCSVRR